MSIWTFSVDQCYSGNPSLLCSKFLHLRDIVHVRSKFSFMTWIFFCILQVEMGEDQIIIGAQSEFRILLVVVWMQQWLMELVFALCNLLCNLWTLCFGLLCLIIMQVCNFLSLFCSCIHDASWLFCVRQFQTLLWLTMYYRSCTCLLCRHVCKQARRWSLLRCGSCLAIENSRVRTFRLRFWLKEKIVCEVADSSRFICQFRRCLGQEEPWADGSRFYN